MSVTAFKPHFHPFEFEQGKHAVLKAETEGGKERRYLCGISSGVKIDKHGERMTENCVSMFMEQANAGNVLLYPDIHGIQASQDIGILTKAKVMPDGDWYTEYRLYDSDDQVDTASIERADKIWKQVRGDAPYKKPMQKGFSIEGHIPDDGILEARENEKGEVIGGRVIDKVFLDGVCLVPRPAYYDSVATAVFKSLGELTPQARTAVRKSISGRLSEKVREDEMKDNYFRKRWDLSEALECEIDQIMKGDAETRSDRLNVLFDEYKVLMTKLLMSSASLFVNEEDAPVEDTETITSEADGTVSKSEIYRSLLSEVTRLEKIIAKR